jgi:beta-lactamase regulating signal transducer with metallopeptidase domain
MRINRTTSVLTLMILVGLIIWLQVSLLLLHEIFNYHLLANIVNSAPVLNHHSKLYSILSNCMNIVIIYSLILFLWRLAVHYIEMFRWNHALKLQEHKMLSNQMMSAYSDWQITILVIHNDHSIVQTYGFLHPKIIISTGIINKLNRNDLEVVMLHQYNHCKNYNPLRSLIAWIIKESLPFMPIQRGLFHYLRVWMELQADRYAIDRMNSINLALLNCQSPPEAVQYRIQQFQQKKLNIRVPFWSIGSLVISFSMILIICMLTLSIGS